ncbi:MAG: LptE family protein [Candidatus Marinimicrobia bacterium]|nr:LptE family protein [Candidatus Neomarinimicrobiota bacterium]
MVKILHKLKIILLIIIVFMITSCWYYSVRPGAIPEGVTNIAVPKIKNETAEFNLGENLTASVIEEIISENILPLVDEDGASSILYVTIKNINEKPHTYNEMEVVKEYKISISAKYQWYDGKEKVDLMTGNISQYEMYYSDDYNNEVSPDDQIKREDAILKLNNLLAEKLVLQLTSDW